MSLTSVVSPVYANYEVAIVIIEYLLFSNTFYECLMAHLLLELLQQLKMAPDA